MTNEQLSSVQCPTCGASIGEPCIWDFGGLRLGTHLNRELSASALIERDDNRLKSLNLADSAGLERGRDPNFGRLTR